MIYTKDGYRYIETDRQPAKYVDFNVSRWMERGWELVSITPYLDHRERKVYRVVIRRPETGRDKGETDVG